MLILIMNCVELIIDNFYYVIFLLYDDLYFPKKVKDLWIWGFTDFTELFEC